MDPSRNPEEIMDVLTDVSGAYRNLQEWAAVGNARTTEENQIVLSATLGLVQAKNALESIHYRLKMQAPDTPGTRRIRVSDLTEGEDFILPAVGSELTTASGAYNLPRLNYGPGHNCSHCDFNLPPGSTSEDFHALTSHLQDVHDLPVHTMNAVTVYEHFVTGPTPSEMLLMAAAKGAAASARVIP